MASAPRTIKCDTCGIDYETRTRNAKRCRVCQLLATLEYLGQRTTTCIIEPHHEFVNLLDQREAPVCGEHQLGKRAQDVAGECKLCRANTTTLVHDTVHICRACITKPENREKVLTKLRQKQAWQAKQAHGRQDPEV